MGLFVLILVVVSKNEEDGYDGYDILIRYEIILFDVEIIKEDRIK